MKLEEIYDSLCVHDPRNSFYKDMIAAGEPPEDMPTPRVGCSCDSCFRGNDKLALEIIRLQDALVSALVLLEAALPLAPREGRAIHSVNGNPYDTTPDNLVVVDIKENRRK